MKTETELFECSSLKKTDFNLIRKFEVKRVEKEINNLPVRKFGYLSPNEILSRLKGSVALTG